MDPRVPSKGVNKMASGIILSECLKTLTYLGEAAIVDCEPGRVTIDVTHNGDFIVENGPYLGTRSFKKSEAEKILGYIGEITKITILNHKTDEEVVLDLI